MVKVVGVRFKRAGKIYYFDPAGHDLSPSDHVIVETARGVEYGEVVVGPKEVPEDEIVAPLKEVMRKATEEDALVVEENHRKEGRAFEVCQEKIAAHGLPMKLVDVEYTFDNNKIIFYFTAEGRVDFRELVRDLASVFRTRVELRQIGVRDEAKMIGGLGPCGRQLCCASFLGDFEPVSIKMAKDQNLSLNPTKISGICGRLMCCLKFESDVYKDTRETASGAGAGCGACGAAGDGCSGCPRFSATEQGPGEAAVEPEEPQVPYGDVYGDFSDAADAADATDEMAAASELVSEGSLALSRIREAQAQEPRDPRNPGAGELVGRGGPESRRGRENRRRPEPGEGSQKARGRRERRDHRRPGHAPGESAAAEGVKAEAPQPGKPGDARPESAKPKSHKGRGRRRDGRGGASQPNGNAGQTSPEEKPTGHVPKDRAPKGRAPKGQDKGRGRHGERAAQEGGREGRKQQAVDGQATPPKAAGGGAPGHAAMQASDQAAEKAGRSGRGPRGRRGRGPRRDRASLGPDRAGRPANQPTSQPSELTGK